ncbi:MAG TPA: type II toxin-antitoxin system VapC family toxin [Azospirillum sp.]
MRLLLDTHALIWFLMGNERMSPSARAAIQDPSNEVTASAVSGYEAAFKVRQGKLDFAVIDELPRMLRQARIGVLAITLDHALAAGRLPGPHRDPWDRILMAQAASEGLRVVTVDPVFADYGVPTFW